jgi:hypothetical protein
VNANKLSGKPSVLKIERDGVVLATQAIQISGDSYVQSFPFQLKADKSGVQRYKVSVSPVAAEYTLANNVRDFFIEVIDSRQKVLVLANAPHPDIAAIRQSLQSNENYEVEVKLATEFAGSLKPYSLVILHELPSKSNLAQRIIQELDASQIPTWFIAGNETLTGLLNPVQSLVQFSGGKGSMNEVTPRMTKILLCIPFLTIYAKPSIISSHCKFLLQRIVFRHRLPLCSAKRLELWKRIFH